MPQAVSVICGKPEGLPHLLIHALLIEEIA